MPILVGVGDVNSLSCLIHLVLYSKTFAIRRGSRDSSAANRSLMPSVYNVFQLLRTTARPGATGHGVLERELQAGIIRVEWSEPRVQEPV